MFATIMRRAGVAAIFVFTVLVGAVPASAQVVFDSASNMATATVSTATSITASWSHTVGAAKKPYLVVGISMDKNGGGQTVTTVQYGNEAGGPKQDMQFLGTASNGTIVRAELWGLAAPVAGTHTILVTVANAGGNNTAIIGSSKSFSNVFQTASTGTVVAATNAGSTTPTVSVTN